MNGSILNTKVICYGKYEFFDYKSIMNERFLSGTFSEVKLLQIMAIFPFLRWMLPKLIHFGHRKCCLFCRNTSLPSCDDEIDKNDLNIFLKF